MFQKKLKFIRKKITHLPQAKVHLFSILEEAKGCICKVDQSHSQVVCKYSSLLVRALVKPVLTRHQDEEIKGAVVTCISEVARIATPNAPYDDDTTRQILSTNGGKFLGVA